MTNFDNSLTFEDITVIQTHNHTARKTFVCTAIRLGINPVVIMKITGHKSYNTMKPYIDAEDKVRREAMDKFNTLE